MISLLSLVLATTLTLSAPGVPSAPCRDATPGERGFGLALDWARAAESGPPGPRLIRAVSSSEASTRPATIDCVLVAAAPGPRAFRSTVAAQRVLPEPAIPPRPDDGPGWLEPFSFFVSLTGVHDTNINHSEEPLASTGVVGGIGTRFETDNFEVEYEVAKHEYSNTDRWDRVSHSVTTSFEQRVAKKLSMEAVGELTLKGSSEDRELNDQYVLEPRINYRFSPSSRLRLYGAHRLRRYDDNQQRDATNQYAGAEFRQRLGSGAFDVGYRWETNRAEGRRYSYERQTYSLQYATPLAGGLHRLAAEVKYRPQNYSHRFVDDEEDEPLRRDKRWIFSLEGSIALGRHLELLPGYRYETRFSNDEEEEFEAHVGYVGLRFWFGKGRNSFTDRRRPAETAAAAVKDRPQVDDAEDRAARAITSNHPAPAMRTSRHEKWSKQAEAGRLRLLRAAAGNYAIDLGLRCGDELEEAWLRDSDYGSLWIIPSERADCFRLFWGHFSSRRDADRDLRTVPGYFRRGGGQPIVVAITSREAAAAIGATSR